MKANNLQQLDLHSVCASMNWIYNVYKLIVRSVHWVQRPAGYPYTAVSVGPTLVEGGLNPADQFVDFR